MTRTVTLMERIYCYYFKCIYLKNERLFAILIVFWVSTLNFVHFQKKKKKLYSLSISEFIDFKDMVLKGIKGAVSDNPSRVNMFKQNLSTKP